MTLRPGGPDDVPALRRIRTEPSVTRWWGPAGPDDDEPGRLAGDGDSVLLVVEVDGGVAGGIEYAEEPDPDYRHAGIDVFLGDAYQGRGLGAEAVAMLARFLLGARGHHRLTIDPAADNLAAIRCYEKVGFRAVGVMREYERGDDGTYHDGLLMELLAEDLSPHDHPRGEPGG